MVVLHRYLWLTLTELKYADRRALLNAPVSPSGREVPETFSRSPLGGCRRLRECLYCVCSEFNKICNSLTKRAFFSSSSNSGFTLSHEMVNKAGLAASPVTWRCSRPCGMCRTPAHDTHVRVSHTFSRRLTLPVNRRGGTLADMQHFHVFRKLFEHDPSIEWCCS